MWYVIFLIYCEHTNVSLLCALRIKASMCYITSLHFNDLDLRAPKS